VVKFFVVREGAVKRMSPKNTRAALWQASGGAIVFKL
jgi:hypothetical protein